MKKKCLLVLSLLVFLFTGCGKERNDDLVLKLKDKINNLDSYYVEGELALYNNEDKYSYDVFVSYKKDNNFKVLLKNKVNNHEQIILRNNDGVYVLTPSLNKSFKFQSEWPYNNSQSYLPQIIIKDIEEDKTKEIIKNDDEYIIKTKANYSNNK